MFLKYYAQGERQPIGLKYDISEKHMKARVCHTGNWH